MDRSIRLSRKEINAKENILACLLSGIFDESDGRVSEKAR
jgi:hypothetical protein